MLYTLYFLEMLITYVWCSFVVGYPDAFDWIAKTWYLWLIVLILAALLVSFTLFSERSRQPPINFAVYFGFILAFAFGMGWVSLLDTSFLVYFTVTTLTLISLGFMLYAM